MPKLPDSEYFKFVACSDSNELLVIFSQVAVPKGKFGLSTVFGEMKINKLFINTRQDDWYINGIPDLGDLNYSVEIIKTFLAEVDFAKVYTFGVSMGGFGALLYGAKLGVDQVYAFGAEHELFIPYSKSKGHNRNMFPSGLTDFRSVLAFPESAKTRFNLFAGSLDLIDMYSISRLSGLPQVELYYANNVNHSVTTWLNDQGLLNDFLIMLFSLGGKAVDFNRFGFKELTEEDSGLYSNAYSMLISLDYLTRLRKMDQADLLAQALIAMLPDHPLVIRLLAKQQAKNKNYQDALKTMESAILLTPNEAKLYKEAAVYASKAGEADKAILLIEKCLTLTPKKWGFLLAKAEILIEAKSYDLVKDYLTDVEYLFKSTDAKNALQKVKDVLRKLGHRVSVDSSI